MNIEATKSVYASLEQIEDYITAMPAVLIDSTVSTLPETHMGYNKALADVEQFEVDIYVYCTKADEEASSQWWEHGLMNLAEADGLDTDHIWFNIYPDDETNPNSWKCECGWWDGDDHKCTDED